MLSSTSATALTALWAASTAVELFSTLDQSSTAGTTGSTTSAQAPPLHSAVKVFLPLAATVALITAVACIYRHLHRAAAGGNRRLPELITFTLCASAGILVFSFFVQTGDDADDGAQARALGMAALGALPAAAVVTFFLGMALVFPVHVRVGGEGGGGAVAGDGSVQAPMWLLTKMALVAAAALVGLMAMALYSKQETGQLETKTMSGDAWAVAVAALLRGSVLQVEISDERRGGGVLAWLRRARLRSGTAAARSNRQGGARRDLAEGRVSSRLEAVIDRNTNS